MAGEGRVKAQAAEIEALRGALRGAEQQLTDAQVCGWGARACVCSASVGAIVRRAA